MAIDITIHGTGTGQCSLSGKDCEGLTVSFKDGTLTESFLSQKSLMQLIKMKAGKNGKTKSDSISTPESRTEGINRNQTIGVGPGSSESKPVASSTSK